VIGINTLVVRSDPGGDVAEGLGFAIPSNTVKQVTGQLMISGKVSRPFIGVTYTMLNAQIAGANNVPVQNGAWIQEVTAGSPAAKAGLKADDVITAINNQPLNESTPVVNVLQQYKVGDTLQLTVLRGGNTITVKLTLGERPGT
jgi:S1-C subfamily serine protease